MARHFAVNWLAAALLAFSVSVLAQEDRYVHVNGNDQGNDCTFQGTPCQTIAHALGQSGNGDTIHIGAGSFTESVSISNRVVTLAGQGSGPGGTIVQAHEDGPDSANSRVLNVQSSASVKVQNLWIRHGNPGSPGGGIRVSGAALTLTGARVSDNRGTSGGGIHLINQATLTVDNTVVRDNLATLRGGGIDIVGNSVATISSGSRIIDNQSGNWAGGIYAAGELLILSDSYITGNEADRSGGGIAAGSPTSSSGSDVVISHTLIAFNIAVEEGGGIWSHGELDISDSEIAGNQSGGMGGGLFVRDNQLNIMQSSISDNQSGSSGGGIRLQDAAVARISRSTISRNVASPCGGGIHAHPLADVTLVNSTVSGNITSICSPAVGFQLSGGDGRLVLVNTTITDNAGLGSNGAVQFPTGDSAETDVRNTIIARQRGNTPDCHNHPVSTGNNLSSDSSCGFSMPGDIVNADAGLLPLYDNGGPTLTHALLPESPAIGAGAPAACAGPDVTNVDQRTVIRPQGSQCDIGAFEFNGLIFQIATHHLEDGTVPEPYSQTLSTAGGVPPYTWSVVDGQLPDGLALDAGNGTISGEPVLAGEFGFRVQVIDHQGDIARRDFSIAIGTVPGFTVIHPGDQASGVPFDIEIVDAYGHDGPLNGARQVEVDSAREGTVFMDAVEFSDGQAVIEGVVMNVFGEHEVEIDIGVAWQTIVMTVVGTASVEIEFDGDGSGRVVSIPAGLDCRSSSGGDCVAEFPGGELLTIEAIPDDGSQFVEWCVVGEGCFGLDTNPFEFDLPSSLTFIAVFEVAGSGDDNIFADRFEE